MNLEDVIDFIVDYSIPIVSIGAAIFLYKKMMNKINAINEKEETDYAKKWEKEHLENLATNLAIRETTPEEEYGKRFDTRYVPFTFNPKPELLEYYLTRLPMEKIRLYNELTKTTAKISEEIKNID